MKPNKARIKILSTPGFLEKAQQHGAPTSDVLRILQGGDEPTWVVGDPAVTQYVEDDGGRTARIPWSFKFYAIRDDHEFECDCGCEGMSVVTFLLPEEY